MASAPTIYVATTGSDTTGDGSASAPYATIGHAVSVASSGDIVQVMDAGPYLEGDIYVPTKTGLTIRGAGAYLGDDTVTEVDATGHTRGIYLYDDITLEHLWFHGASGHGVEMPLGTSLDCYCTHVRSSGNGGDGFHVGGNLSTFHRCQADGNGGVGFYVNGSDVALSACLAFSNTSDGAYVPGANAVVENCTLSDNGRHGLNALGGTVRNVVATGNTQYGIKATAPTVYACDAWGNGYGDYSGTVGDAASLSVDPVFADQASGDYTLTPSSPCVGAGAAQTLGEPDDLAGVAWSSPPSMGAYEVGAPALLSVTVESLTELRASFSAAMAPNTVEGADSWIVTSNGDGADVVPVDATLLANGTDVRITVHPWLSPGEDYTLTAPGAEGA